MSSCWTENSRREWRISLQRCHQRPMVLQGSRTDFCGYTCQHDFVLVVGRQMAQPRRQPTPRWGRRRQREVPARQEVQPSGTRLPQTEQPLIHHRLRLGHLQVSDFQTSFQKNNNNNKDIKCPSCAPTLGFEAVEMCEHLQVWTPMSRGCQTRKKREN